MRISTWILRSCAVVRASASVAACVGFGGLGNGLDMAACPELGGGALNANFSADAKANATLRAFVQASGDLAMLSARVEADVGAACSRIGADLGLSEAEMGEGTEARWAAASARTDGILKAGVNAKISAQVTPPVCKASVDAYASCSGQCSGKVDPGSIVASCEPARLSGTCEGTCGGQCDGTCNGTCSGNCSAKDAQGRCIGQCSGTCTGQCSATCHAKCDGTWKAPQCQTDVKGPSASAKCDASCKAHAEITAECTPARVTLQASVNTGEMGKLIATLQANLPVLIQAEVAYGQRIAGDVRTLVEIGGELPGIVGQAGLHAAACIGASANAVLHAQASISVSVKASASVTGKAGAHAG